MCYKEKAIEGLFDHMLQLGEICQKAFAKQNKINNRLFVIAALGAAYIAFAEKQRKEHEEKIEKLSKELKTMKGE